MNVKIQQYYKWITSCILVENEQIFILNKINFNIECYDRICQVQMIISIVNNTKNLKYKNYWEKKFTELLNCSEKI